MSVAGDTNVSGTLTANTVSATTYIGLPPLNPSDLSPITLDTVNGRVGINEGVPTQALEVYGNVLVSAGVRAGQLISTSNGVSFENPGSGTYCFIKSETGSPQSVITAPIGSIFLRTNGAAGTCLYIKESGTGNTGWVPVITNGAITLTTAAQPNITSLGTLTGLTITSGGNLLLNATKVTSGTGTPEAAVTAPIGSLFLRTDGAAGTCIYIKESGAGNTGWVPIITALSGAITLTTAAQPNVTSLGTLTGLTLSGAITPTYSGTSPTSSQIGYSVVTSQSTTNITASTTANLTSISLGSGVWEIQGQTDFTSTSTSLLIWFSLSTTSATIDVTRATTITQVTNFSPRYLTLSSVFALSGTTTVYWMYNNPSVTGCSSTRSYIRYTRIA